MPGLTDLKKGLTALQNFGVSELVREKELGQVGSFKRLEPEIVKIKEFSGRVYVVVDKTEVPQSLLEAFESNVKQIYDHYIEIRDYDPKEDKTDSKRNHYLTAIPKLYNTFHKLALEILVIGFVDDSELNKKKSELDDLIAKYIQREQESKKVLKRTEKYAQDIADSAESVRSAVTLTGVTKHSTLFSEESEKHRIRAQYALVGIALLVVVIVAIAWLSLFYADEFTKIDIVQLSLSKVVILSTLVYALGLAARNYKVHKHNQILNRHKFNALSTFETFVGSETADLQTKNAVLLETTRAVFSNRPTGYLRNEGDHDSQNKIVEVIKNVIPGQKESN